MLIAETVYHLKEVRDVQEPQAGLCMLLVGICEDKLWQVDALQKLAQRPVFMQHLLVGQCAMHCCVPMVEIYLVAIGLRTMPHSLGTRRLPCSVQLLQDTAESASSCPPGGQWGKIFRGTSVQYTW